MIISLYSLICVQLTKATLILKRREYIRSHTTFKVEPHNSLTLELKKNKKNFPCIFKNVFFGITQK